MLGHIQGPDICSHILAVYSRYGIIYLSGFPAFIPANKNYISVKLKQIEILCVKC